jgi:2-polyprenyl-3-methyl-5-hydroxy-6-metoxy-1,4-benzoquinol methylase
MLAHSVAGEDFVIDGIEANAEWAEMARPLYRSMWSCFAENAPLEPGTYKLVVCGDVLEHTPDPVGVLRKLIEASAADARFIISLPNVAHLAIRMMLLFGRFPKMERGILDKTHLQFFTKDTATDMLKSAGLQVEKVSCTGVPLDEIWKSGEGKLLYKLMTKSQHLALAVAPRLFGFQWIFLARRANG